MVLGGDEATVGQFTIHKQTHRLVMSTVTILQLGHLGTRRKREDLVTHADTIDRFALLHELTDMLHRLGAEVRVARTVRNEESVVLLRREVIVPRDNRYAHVELKQLTDDILFHTHVHQADPFATVSEMFHLLRADERHLVDKVRILERNILLSLRDDHTAHATIFTKTFGELTRIDSRDTHHLFSFQPFRQRALSVPVAVMD